MLKIGDRIRFLNATGGGIVSKIINREMVLVTDNDGFDVPTLIRECVVVESATTIHTQEKPQKPQSQKLENVTIESVEDDEYQPEEETQEGEKLNVLLAYVPQNPKMLSTTDYDCFLVNDSNYYLGYNLASGNGHQLISRATGFIQPNTKILLEEVTKGQLNDIEQLRLQLIALKQKKAYQAKPTYDVQIKVNPVKFYKLHSFVENDYFDELALLFPIVKNDMAVEREIRQEDFDRIVVQKEEKNPPKVSVKSNVPEVIEVDLHIHQLLDNLNGLSNADILNYQLDKFNETLQTHAKRKGQKIVFIHGKGDGVLRKEILKQLKHKYPTYYVQDASFREYGFGATMVTIR